MQFVYLPDKNWAPATPRGGKPMARHIPPPCKQCPKQNPTVAFLYELTPQNRQAVEFYRMHRATNFGCLSEAEKRDETLKRNMAIIDDVFREVERQEQQQDAMMLMQSSFAAFKQGLAK